MLWSLCFLLDPKRKQINREYFPLMTHKYLYRTLLMKVSQHENLRCAVLLHIKHYLVHHFLVRTQNCPKLREKLFLELFGGLARL